MTLPLYYVQNSKLLNTPQHVDDWFFFGNLTERNYRDKSLNSLKIKHIRSNTVGTFQIYCTHFSWGNDIHKVKIYHSDNQSGMRNWQQRNWKWIEFPEYSISNWQFNWRKRNNWISAKNVSLCYINITIFPDLQKMKLKLSLG